MEEYNTLIISNKFNEYIKDYDAKVLIIEEGIEIICENVIFDCPYLEKIIIPKSLREFYSNSFSLCPNIIEFQIPENHEYFCVKDQAIFTKDEKALIKYIDKENYKGYEIPRTVEQIQRGAFKNTKYLSELWFEGSIKEIPPYCFENTNIESIILPEGIEKISHHAFYHARIKEISIPNSVNIISDYVFEKCEKLQKIAMPKMLTYFGVGAFKDCLLLKSIRLSYGIEKLIETFINCKSLKKVYIPETVIEEKNAFNRNAQTQLYGKVLPNTFLKYGENEYEEDSIYKPKIKKSTYKDYQNAKIKDIVTLGSWMKRAENDYKEPLEWIVIDKSDNKLLLLSKYALKDMPFSNQQCNDWNESCINEYLNNEFFEEVFHPMEQKAILEKNICSYDFAERKPYEHYKSKVFLLNFEEASSLDKDIYIAKCTDSLYIHTKEDLYTSWWLSSIDENKFDYVSKKGEFLTDDFSKIHSIRPAIWVDVNQLNIQTNEEYIKQWFMKNNPYISLQKNKDSFLEKLCHYVILFEKLDGLKNDDYLMKDAEKITLVSGYIYESERKKWIMKMINYLYAYLDEEYMSKDAIYKQLYKYDFINGIITEDVCNNYFKDWYDFYIRHYGKNEFKRIPYRLNNNVYFSDQYLSQEEIEQILKLKPSEQRLFDIDHNEDGSFNCW